MSGSIRAYATALGGESSIDPNRNFPDPLSGDHADGLAWAPETKAMMAFATQHAFNLSVNLHGGAELVNYPWDDQSTRHVDDVWFRQLSRAYADLAQADGPSGYMDEESNGITNGNDWYFADGTRQDYMTYFQGGREVTIEVSGTKTPAASALASYWQANRRALLGYLSWALRGVRGKVTDPQGAPVAATVTVVNTDTATSHSAVTTNPAVGDYHRMLPAGTYDLRFESEGFVPRKVTGVVVAPGAASATRVDVVLTPAARLDLHGVVRDTNGWPVPEVQVELVGTSQAPVLSRRNGSYSFKNLPEGSYTALLTPRSVFATKEQPFDASAASPQVDFRLSRIVEVFSADLESSDGGLVAAGSPSPRWQWGTPGAAVGTHTGTRVWGAPLNGTYANNAAWTLDLGPVSLPQGLASSLSFWHQFETESGYDGGQVQVSIDGGAFQLLQPIGGYPQPQVDALRGAGFAGSSSGWKVARFDLSAQAGHSVKVRFRFASDAAEVATGWHLDDLQIESHKL
ncbi:MAG: carboxypeptidase regulatory-like domain-containing protein [Myxococcales bacterium]